MEISLSYIVLLLPCHVMSCVCVCMFACTTTQLYRELYDWHWQCLDFHTKKCSGEWPTFCVCRWRQKTRHSHHRHPKISKRSLKIPLFRYANCVVMMCVCVCVACIVAVGHSHPFSNSIFLS